MRKNLSQLVWAVLLAAFAVFCILAIGIPLGVRSYLHSATVETPASLETISGTVLMQGPGDAEPIGLSMVDTGGQAVPHIREVKEGTTVITDGSSRAILTFQHSSSSNEEIVLSTVQLYNNTRVQIVESRGPRFPMSSKPDRLVLRIDAGQMRIAPTRLKDVPPFVQVITPHGDVFLEEGSYSIRVTNEAAEVAVRFGSAVAESNGHTLSLLSGQRTEMRLGSPMPGPLPAAQNLIVNGNFSKPLSPSWQIRTFEATADATAGEAEIVTATGRKAVFFSRMGEDGIHSEVEISQVINRDVLDFESLVLRLDIKLLYQSLSGGGYLSSEFPLMVRIDYKDIYGIDRFWTHGFYYQNVDNYPIQPDVWGRPSGEQIPHAVWYPYESENLLVALGDIRPARVHSIRIYASGWNFQSMISEVGLIGE